MAEKYAGIRSQFGDACLIDDEDFSINVELEGEEYLITISADYKDSISTDQLIDFRAELASFLEELDSLLSNNPLIEKPKKKETND